MSKRVVVVGAVAGGMSAATRLRCIDETLETTVFEQGSDTSFANCGLSYALGNIITDDAALILNTPEGFKDRFNFDVHLDTEFIGIEATENMRKIGLEVSLVELSLHILPPINADITKVLQKELNTKGVDLFVNARLKSIEKSSVTLEDRTHIPAGLVIMTAGVRARTLIAIRAGLDVGSTGVKVNSQMRTSDPDIYAVGDMVGLSIDALRRKGDDPQWATVHSQDHTGYYPNANTITLKPAFGGNTGRILGAQAVGMAGVDKRIDVMATAMHADMTAFDLEHLELAYAPPYGSAKDVVNMAGFVASNVLCGDVQILHAEDLDTKTLAELQIIDVRSPKEFARSHLPGAIDLPVNDLRKQMWELDRSIRVLVYCQVGYRGYLALRILKQTGFDVVNLDGGFKTVVDGGFEVG